MRASQQHTRGHLHATTARSRVERMISHRRVRHPRKSKEESVRGERGAAAQARDGRVEAFLFLGFGGRNFLYHRESVESCCSMALN